MEIKICKNCNKKYKYTKSQGKGYFCCQKCQGQYVQNENIQKWLLGEIDGHDSNGKIKSYVRKYLLEEVNYKCSVCGWGEKNSFNNKIHLEIDHIDGSLDSRKSNLRVLCPNCHSLTPTYKVLNTSYSKNKQKILNEHNIKVERKKINNQNKINERIRYLKTVDLSEWGSLTLIANEWNIASTNVKKFIIKYYPQGIEELKKQNQSFGAKMKIIKRLDEKNNQRLLYLENIDLTKRGIITKIANDWGVKPATVSFFIKKYIIKN
jgi:Zn finger protein HypA/HybF involved in hydrogenase expression